ncbi:hypothetical protein L2729_12450 [Shewanella gelidimarina]|uniref:hypothetical protein n=1 Tax=Shewanella gelidimarina TaxID=56813 RepID=UPI0020109551|nr:hypothetical protein [Shewanella gelidimarina]MCL1058792.1 hypothetical protein [Shewanella gelidimarina]
MEPLPKMPEPRITISFNPSSCLQGVEFPLNGQTFNATGIIGLSMFAKCLDIKSIV